MLIFYSVLVTFYALAEKGLIGVFSRVTLSSNSNYIYHFRSYPGPSLLLCMRSHICQYPVLAWILVAFPFISDIKIRIVSLVSGLKLVFS